LSRKKQFCKEKKDIKKIISHPLPCPLPSREKGVKLPLPCGEGLGRVFIEYRLYTQTLHNTDHLSPGEILQAAGTGEIQLNFQIELNSLFFCANLSLTSSLLK
jgi:hypothetical protein